jgi:UDP-MurNAc hydroxylase
MRQIARPARGEVHILRPADRIALDGTLRFEPPRERHAAPSDASLREYETRRGEAARAYLAALPPLPPFGMAQFREHLRVLFASSTLVRERINALVKFAVCGANGGVLFADTRRGGFALTSVTPGRPTCEIAIDSRIARRLVERDETWEDVFSSMRFRVRRDPDFYNWPLFAILQHGHDASLIRSVEDTLRGMSLDAGARAAGQAARGAGSLSDRAHDAVVVG